jgi:hypothetical protein
MSSAVDPIERQIGRDISEYIDMFNSGAVVKFFNKSYNITKLILSEATDEFKNVIEDIYQKLNNPTLQFALNIRLNPGVALDDDLPYLNFTAEIQLIDYDLVSDEELNPEIAARFSISTSFFNEPFQNICGCAQIPRYMIPPNMNIFVEESYRGKQVPRLLICGLVFLLETLFHNTFTDSSYLYIDADGSTIVKEGKEGQRPKTFWDNIGMVNNEDDVIESYSEGYEKRIQVCALKYDYLFNRVSASQCVIAQPRSCKRKQTASTGDDPSVCVGREKIPYNLRPRRAELTENKQLLRSQSASSLQTSGLGGSKKTQKKRKRRTRKSIKRKRNISLKKKR